MAKIGMEIRDELGNLKGESDFKAFEQECLPMRTSA